MNYLDVETNESSHAPREKTRFVARHTLHKKRAERRTLKMSKKGHRMKRASVNESSPTTRTPDRKNAIERTDQMGECLTTTGTNSGSQMRNQASENFLAATYDGRVAISETPEIDRVGYPRS